MSWKQYDSGCFAHLVSLRAVRLGMALLLRKESLRGMLLGGAGLLLATVGMLWAESPGSEHQHDVLDEPEWLSGKLGHDQESIHFYTPIVLKPPRPVELTGAFERCPDSTQPCFKDNKDILNGQRQLLQIDDLVIGGLFTFNDATDFRSSAAILDTSNSTISSVEPFGVRDANGAPPGIHTMGGRFFNRSSDVILKAVFSAYEDWSGPAFDVWLYSQGKQLADSTLHPTLPNNAPSRSLGVSGVKADFTGDSFDDALYLTDAGLFVATAVDVNDPTKGVRFGPVLDLPTQQQFFASGLVAGRFRGKIEAALIGQPQDDGHQAQAGLILTLLSIDPKTLAITVTGSQKLAAVSGVVSTTSLATGHFNTLDHDQLAVNYLLQPSGLDYILGVDFDTQGNISAKAQSQIGQDQHPGNVLIRPGRFDFQGQFDQLASLLWEGNGNSHGFAIAILGFDDQMNVVKPYNYTPDPAPQCFYDMQVGNFDRMQPDPANPGKTIHNPNLQIAVATGLSSCGPDGVKVSIWNVTGNQHEGWTLTPNVSTRIVPITDDQGESPASIQGLSLASADAQGRSLILGDPTIVVMSDKVQPSVILASPPMHVDYVVPVEEKTPKIFNFTAAPGGFYTSYQTSSGTDTEKSTTNSTSWSFAAQETLSQNFTLGDCDLGDCASFDAKESSKQALDGSNASLHGTFSSDSTSISDQTGFADSLWYSSSTLTSYVYPVIGRKVCPAGKTTCTNQEMVQETVQFAGPDTITSTTADGRGEFWYQPAWMPGNLLSYPGNQRQLQVDAFSDPSSFDLLTSPQQWFTDSSDATAQANWTKGSKDGSTTSLNQNYSFETELSFTLKAGLDDIATASGSASLDLSGSVGLSRLTNSTTTLTKSIGIGFTKKATFANPGEYGYYVTPYIFGQIQPGGVVDNKPLSTEVQTFGILQTGHVVDPLASGSGAFWTDWYTKGIDIGLNQPSRWIVQASPSDPHDGSCLIFDNASSDVDCAKLGDKTPNDPWSDEFHWMRGLLISRLSPSGNGSGPQIGQATAGDQLLLRARVYNFSLTQMPPGSSAHVRFYGTPWNAASHVPAGPSFVIGEQAAGPIRPFNTDTPYPNWLFVDQTFDTTAYGNQDLVFWVVVWAQDATGALIAELPHHGLKSIPPATASYARVAALEEKYGNNIGFYHHPFHVFANDNSAVQSTGPGGIDVPAEIILVGSESGDLVQGESTMIAAKLRVGSAELRNGIHLHFYDGNPSEKGKLIAHEHLPYLQAQKIYEVKVKFRPGEVGVHRIFIVAGQGTQLEHEVELRPITVRRAKYRMAELGMVMTKGDGT